MRKKLRNSEISNSFKIQNSKFKIIFGRHSENGIALIIVVSIMAVLASIAAAFSYSMIMDQRAAANYMTGIKADYIAKAGIQHAIGVLKKDGDPSNTAGPYVYEGYDWYGDDWGYDGELFGGDSDDDDSNIDNDGLTSTHTADCGSGMDSRWVNLTDSQGNLIGRYAVLVIDESGKVNINTAGVSSQQNEGWTTGEVNLSDVCTAVGVPVPSILSARYGTNPGVSGEDDNHDSVVLNNDGIDNDGDNDPAGTDGADEPNEGVDDPAEFYISKPYTTSGGLSADTPFVTTAEVVSLAEMSGGNYKDLSPYITAWSSDKNLTDSGLARLNINAVSSAMELYSTLRDAFEYWEPSTTYSTAELAQMAVNIIDFRDRDNGSTRIDVEDGSGTVFTRYGVEGIRINEVMVRPVFRKDTNNDGTGEGDKISTGGSWTWNLGHGYWQDAPGGGDDTDIWRWTTATVPVGTYKLTVYGAGGGNIKARTSGNNGATWLPSATGWYNGTDYVDCDTVIITNSVQIEIMHENADLDVAYFDSAVFSQSPDCEYVELVNISPSSVDVGGWKLEFPNGRVGTIPGGTSIAAMGDSSGGDIIVLAIDRHDTNVNNGSNVYNNGIYFTKEYGVSDRVYQLGFSGGDVWEDMLADTVLMDSPLRLYNKGQIGVSGAGDPPAHIVDQVLWDSSIIQTYEFWSMERDDPAYLGTDVLNDSGIFDTWLISAVIKGSPTEANNGASLTNIKVKNSPFANIGEVADVAYSKTKWTNIGTSETRIKNIADRITVSGRRLDAEFADLAEVEHWGSSEAISVDEKKRKFGGKTITGELYWFEAGASASNDEDTWTWYTTINRFEADTYIMYVYGREGGTMTVRVGDDTPVSIIPSSDYGARYGQVVVSDTTLSVAIQTDASSADSAFFDYILLTPASKTYGRININTAGSTVLQSLKGISKSGAPDIDPDDIVDDTPLSSIGELVWKDGATGALTVDHFKPISNLITTKSNVFKIICTGQSVLDKNGNGFFDAEDEVLGERKITVIYER